MKSFRIWLARRILGAHCPCYVMGADHMVNFQQRNADKLHSFHNGQTHESSHTADIGY